MKLKHSLAPFVGTLLWFAIGTAGFASEPITKDDAIAMATNLHPGEVIKAYQEKKRGVDSWEVKIKGEDGKTWEVYYAIADGELVAEEIDD